MMNANEDNLIEQLKRQNINAQENVVRQYTDLLFKACLGLGFEKFETDDIVQNVWITFFHVVHRFERRSSLKTFLMGILYNKASEYKKKSYRSVSTENIQDVVDSYFDQNGNWMMSQSPISPDRFLESSENMTLIAHCLELLPMNQKLAFMLKEFEDEATEEICHALEVTSTNLGVLLYRARNQLRDCVERKSR